MTKITLKTEKQLVLDYIDINNNPQNWRLYKLLNNKEIKVKRLLKDMERQHLIKIEYINHNKLIKRVLTKKVNNINELYD